MNEFDASDCSYCGRARSQHFVIDDGISEHCENNEDSPIYWPWREIRKTASNERQGFVRDAMMNSLRGGTGLTEESASFFGKVWDAFYAEHERFYRAWRPK